MTPPGASAAAKRAPARRAAPRTRVHRRVSGPARAARPAARTPASAPAAPSIPRPTLGPLAERALATAFRIRDSHVVDRLVRGRLWIGILGALLIGLVGLNVSLLKLNAAAGRNAEWARKLRVEHADLQARVSRLRSGQRIQAAARRLGLVMPAAADVHYLTADPLRDARRAAKRESFTPSWSDSDIVSATPDPAPVAPVAATAPAIPAAAPAVGTTGAQAAAGATGTTGAQPSPQQSVTQQPSTGATIP